MTDTHVVLSGSDRARKQNAERIGDVDPASAVEVTVTVRGPELPQVTPGKSMSREELERRYSARPADMDAVASELAQYGLEVLDSAPSTRSLRVRGTAAQMDAAFRANLGIYRHDGDEFRGREGTLEVPAGLADVVTGVFGLDQRRVARRVPGIPPHEGSAQALADDALSPADLEERYRFPEGEGDGQTVAIAEFGGAYFPSDLQTFCTQQGRPEPSVKQIGLGVAVLTEQEVMALPADRREQVLEEAGEVNMDVQIVAGLCPGADIVVYFATWDQKGWVDLLNEVVKGVPAGSVSVSVSWGLSEDSSDFSPAARRVIDHRLQAAALLGITVCVSAGDDGSGDQVNDGQAHVNFPACSPHVLAVGGTQLEGDQEVVWWQSPGRRSQGGGSTGGGISRLFPQPSWQTVEVRPPEGSTATGRIIPDIAALAGPPFYQLILLGRAAPNGGTSAAAPVWAALVARSAAAASPQRPPVFLAPMLYGAGPDGHPLGMSVCRDITSGSNTSTPPGWGFAAGPGFDAVTGWGVPDGPPLVGTEMAPGAAAAHK
ncbi:MAG TPA: S53 family peptidase [Solirubrobacteraceae bacterium]|jgi:kumamolisin